MTGILRNTIIAAAFGATALLPLKASAATALPDPQVETQEALLVLSSYLTGQTPEQTSAKDFLGESVLNSAGDDIGKVTDLVIGGDGGLVAMVVGVGGFLGVGEKDVALPMSNVVVSRMADGRLRLSTLESVESLKAAPSYRTLEQQASQAPGLPPGTMTTTYKAAAQ